MSKKIYVCRSCGNTFPDELSHLIENKTRVFCERCGSPFTLEGIKFKEPEIKIKEKDKKILKASEEKTSSTIYLLRLM